MLTHKGTVMLTTPRLVLRRLRLNDATAMYLNWASDEKVPKYLSWDVHVSVEVTKELLAKWTPGYDNADYYCWVIEYGGVIVGTIGLHGISDKHERVEMGYCIGSKWWNRGIVTEAAGAVIHFAFEQLGAHKICALHDTKNAGSGRVMQKNGMKLEGTLRGHMARKDGTWGDLAYYAIFRSEWQSAPSLARL